MDLLCLYRGRTLNDLRLISVSTNAALVREFAESMLNAMSQEDAETPDTDPAQAATRSGVRQALRIIAGQQDYG